VFIIVAGDKVIEQNMLNFVDGTESRSSIDISVEL